MPYMYISYGPDEEVHGIFFTDANQHLRLDTSVLEAFNQANAAAYAFTATPIGTGLYARLYRILFPSLPGVTLNFVAFDAATGDTIGGQTVSMDAAGNAIDVAQVSQAIKDGVYADRQYEIPIDDLLPMQEVWLRQGTAVELLRADLLDEDGAPVRDLNTPIKSAIGA